MENIVFASNHPIASRWLKMVDELTDNLPVPIMTMIPKGPESPSLKDRAAYFRRLHNLEDALAPETMGWFVDPNDEQLTVKPGDVEPSSVIFKSMLHQGEGQISGEERIRRHRESGSRCLSPDQFFYLWLRHDHLPENWTKIEVGKKRRLITFDAVKLRDRDGKYFVPGMCLLATRGSYGQGEWMWLCDDIGNIFDDPEMEIVSAVLG
jgi:hypothetical protein